MLYVTGMQHWRSSSSKLQLKQEDIENRSRRNNIRIRRAPKGAEGSDIIAFTADLLNAIRGDYDTSPHTLDRAYRVTPTPGHPKVALDIL
ncbi:hypothetical protein NDU88_004346 [Pleurodeles waltl]|uniref:Uncharacterized protein n=1 Tax=Pleurodeles waltl TaxID=8319 RepID=A0AAV7L0Q7_PLEWA|nr:hypothetical protein NDU88_004346 [Pleurodeles waltl]